MTAPMQVIVPTRGRLSNVERLIEAFEDTVDPGGRSVALHLVTDDDDPTEYPEFVDGKFALIRSTGPRKGCMGSLNWAAESAVRDGYSIIGFMGDDHAPRTYGWNTMVAQALASPGICYGNDLLQGAALPTAAFLSIEIVRLAGFMVPPTLYHLFCDNYWLMLGANAGCIRYLPGMIIEHIHPAAGKAEVDDSYRHTNSNDMYRKDEEAWNLFAQKELRPLVHKIRNELYGWETPS